MQEHTSSARSPLVSVLAAAVLRRYERHCSTTNASGGRTYANVNKHIAQARARVRLAGLCDAADGGRGSPRPDVA